MLAGANPARRRPIVELGDLVRIVRHEIVIEYGVVIFDHGNRRSTWWWRPGRWWRWIWCRRRPRGEVILPPCEVIGYSSAGNSIVLPKRAFAVRGEGGILVTVA